MEGMILSDVDQGKLAKKKAGVLALDLSSAYDFVSFFLLIDKMDQFLRRNDCLATHSYILLFTLSWVTGRKIYFEKTWFTPSNGVPQGSPVSCSMFVIFLDFRSPAQVAHAQITLYIYADDLSIVIQGQLYYFTRYECDFEYFPALRFLKLKNGCSR